MMALWPRHIDRFEQQYDKAFSRDPLFGADLMDRIHKRVQLLLHSCNTTAIGEVESGALEEFRGLQKRVERGEWMTSMPVWVERPAPREEGRRKSEGQAPTDERETSVGPEIWRPQEKVRPDVRRPQDIVRPANCGAHSAVSHWRPQVWSAVVALTVRPAIATLDKVHKR